MKRQYLKKNLKFWSVKKINKYSEKIWYSVIILMTLTVLWALARNYTDNLPKADPRASVVSQVMASEPDYKVSCEDVVGYIRCKFYSGELTEQEAITLIAIGKAESGLRANAKNKTSTARGVFQIIAGTWYSNNCTGDPWNFKDNTDCAIKIMKSSGFYPWDAYNKGMHLKFMKEVTI
jgi:hypothetical protein